MRNCALLKGQGTSKHSNIFSTYLNPTNPSLLLTRVCPERSRPLSACKLRCRRKLPSPRWKVPSHRRQYRNWRGWNKTRPCLTSRRKLHNAQQSNSRCPGLYPETAIWTPDQSSSTEWHTKHHKLITRQVNRVHSAPRRWFLSELLHIASNHFRHSRPWGTALLKQHWQMFKHSRELL